MRRAPSGAAATMSCFVDAFGEKRGRPCFVVFLQIVHALTLYGRRRMRVGTEIWPTLTHDEVAFLRCIDAGMRGDETVFRAHVAWLVRQHGAGQFGGYIRTLASLMPETMFGMAPAPVRGGRPNIERAAGEAAKRPTPVWSASAFPVAID
jgi:hypothetical protein